MEIGTILLWLALILAILVPVFSILFYITKITNLKNLTILVTIGCILSITIAYFLLTYYFIVSNFHIHYVWYNSSENTEWYLKLTGVWAGQEGSFLLWVWIILISLGIEEGIQFYRRRKKSSNSDIDDEHEENNSQEKGLITAYDWTRIIVILVVLVFLILLVMNDPFEPTHLHEVKYQDGRTGTIDPDDYPAGHGMNPMLRNLWMVIHPPLLFIGYALITIPFAAGLSYSITSDKKWTKISLQWSRLAWLFLTLGIGIGAIWAYVALGWGGYWAWDPVEVAGLVPWITLSAFLHTQLMNKRKNEFGMITPILGTFTFVLVIFGTFITRSGLWTSVHAWSETEVGLILLATMIITLIFSFIIISMPFLKRLISRNLESLDDDEEEDVDREDEIEESEQFGWDSITMIATIIIFAVLAIITFIGLMTTMGKPSPEFYETRLAPFVAILLIVMSICLCWRYFGKENSIYIIAWTALAGIACAVILPMYFFPDTDSSFYSNTITSHNIIGFMTPFSVLVIFSAIYKMGKQLKVKYARNKLKSISPHMIHLGVAFIIMGYVASQTMIIENTKWLQEGDTIEVDEYELKVIKIERKEDTGDLRSKEYWDTWFVTIEIYKNGELLEIGKLNTVYGYSYNSQGQRIYTMVMSSEVFVRIMLEEDLYVSFRNVRANEIEIEAKTIPLMSFIWLGMLLFVFGIIIRITVDYLPSKKTKPDEISKPARKARRPPSKVTMERLKPKKGKKDYEKILDEELKRLRS